MKSFISQIKEHAINLGKEYNILASLLIAQACLESAFGKSGLAKKANNLFGVKEFGNGPSVTMRTAEYDKGKKIHIDAKFRFYPSFKESLEHVCRLYQNGVSWDRNKYKKIIGETDYKKACQAVQQAGYCTDPHYADKLIQIIEKYGLTKYDQKQDKHSTDQKRYVIVKPGDTMTKLFGPKYKEVAKKNGIDNPNLIKVGQKIYY